MKCVKHVESGKVMRVTDSIAEKHVFQGNWKYVAKKVWKETVRDKQQPSKGERNA